MFSKTCITKVSQLSFSSHISKLSHTCLLIVANVKLTSSIRVASIIFVDEIILLVY